MMITRETRNQIAVARQLSRLSRSEFKLVQVDPQQVRVPGGYESGWTARALCIYSGLLLLYDETFPAAHVFDEGWAEPLPRQVLARHR